MKAVFGSTIRRVLPIAALLLLVSPCFAAENPLLALRRSAPRKDVEVARFNPQNKDLRGYEHLAGRFLKYGVDPERVIALFSDHRLPRHDRLFFSIKPREPRSLYRGHNTKATRKNALEFFSLHREAFANATELYGVPQEVILAILQIESRCGSFTGKSPILHRLARLASAADPDNVQANQRRARANTADAMRYAKRAQWLEETFLPHAIATLTLADRKGAHPLEIKGSPAGALGFPQFLPGNLETHGADANFDGIVDLFSPEDAIHSVARFLANHGWTAETLNYHAQKKILLHYNRSDSYVETVLAMARDLRASMPRQIIRAGS